MEVREAQEIDEMSMIKGWSVIGNGSFYLSGATYLII